jgi:hypothetical protein
MNPQPMHMGFGNYDEWNRFNAKYPVFVQRFPGIEAMRDTVFSRAMVGEVIDRVVFGLGWLCFEDWQEITILCGNGFGIGALKLVRGMYERQVTSSYLSRHPNEVDDFLDFDFVQRRKGLNNLRRLYNGEELNRIVSRARQDEIERQYRDVKRDGRYTDTLCGPCGTSRDTMSWTNLSTPDVAQRGGQQLDKFYFPLYNKPTLLGHPSLYSLAIRIRDDADGPGFAFDAEGQRSQVGEALSHAHFLLLHVFGTQNDHFHLGADDQLNALLEDYRACWREGPSTDAEEEHRF